jgi:hypothetical protein
MSTATQSIDHKPPITRKTSGREKAYMCLAKQLRYLDIRSPIGPTMKSLPLPDDIVEKPGRNHNKCPFKCVDSHTLRKCPQFVDYKKMCTKESYISSRLLSNDSYGFCAAGVYLHYGEKVLFLKENRSGSIKFNFPGGGRESLVLEDLKMRPETAKETAASEFVEEMGDLVVGGRDDPTIMKIKSLIIESKARVYWSGKTKFALFWVEIDEAVADSLDPLEVVKNTSEAISFKWMDVNKLIPTLFHNFTYTFLRDIFKVPPEEDI